MTKIPSVEEEWDDVLTELEIKTVHILAAMRTGEINQYEACKKFYKVQREALTAEREAGAREERERVHKFVRKDFHSDFVENGLATRFYEALTPPTK